MDRALFLGLVSAAVMLSAHAIYIRSILQGDTKPNKVTWLLIGFGGSIFVASQIASEVNAALWGIVLPHITTLAITALALKKGITKIQIVDVVAFVVALAGLLAWYLTSDPLVAVVATALVGVISIIPTLNKLWRHPGTEKTLTWVMAATSMGILLIAVEPEIEFVLVPITWVVLNTTVALLNQFRSSAVSL